MNTVQTVAVSGQDEVAAALADILRVPLESGRNVMWLVSGGSSLPVAAAALVQLKAMDLGQVLDGLFVTLVDDKYGVEKTNWDQLLELGFALPKGQMTPIIQKKRTFEEATFEFYRLIEQRVARADVMIGQFGLGDGFHTGGIMPGSPAATSGDLVCGYAENGKQSITVTPRMIGLLDAAFVNSLGASKRPLVERFLTSDATVETEPTQALKTAKTCILCSDVLPQDLSVLPIV